MRKFTIFTVILTVIIIVVVAEVFVNDYLPGLVRTKTPVEDDLELTLPEGLSANILGADVDYSKIPDLEVPEELALLPVEATDFEDESFAATVPSVLIREDQIRSAGFPNAILESEPNDGFLYKTIYVNDLYDVEISKYAVKTHDSLLGKIYTFSVGAFSDTYQVYEVLKSRAAEGLDIVVNENNEFGQGSFYMNDSRRSNVAFLTVRIGSLIYGFSYPKEYHAQIKNIVTLLDLEF